MGGNGRKGRNGQKRRNGRKNRKWAEFPGSWICMSKGVVIIFGGGGEGAVKLCQKLTFERAINFFFLERWGMGATPILSFFVGGGVVGGMANFCSLG